METPVKDRVRKHRAAKKETQQREAEAAAQATKTIDGLRDVVAGSRVLQRLIHHYQVSEYFRGQTQAMVSRYDATLKSS